jgi:hypothetical protein
MIPFYWLRGAAWLFLTRVCLSRARHQSLLGRAPVSAPVSLRSRSAASRGTGSRRPGSSCVETSSLGRAGLSSRADVRAAPEPGALARQSSRHSVLCSELLSSRRRPQNSSHASTPWRRSSESTHFGLGAFPGRAPLCAQKSGPRGPEWRREPESCTATAPAQRIAECLARKAAATPSSARASLAEKCGRHAMTEPRWFMFRPA